MDGRDRGARRGGSRRPRDVGLLLVLAPSGLQQHVREVGVDGAVPRRVLRVHLELGVLPGKDLVGRCLTRQPVRHRVHERAVAKVKLTRLTVGLCLDVAGLPLQVDHLDDGRQRYSLHDTSR